MARARHGINALTAAVGLAIGANAGTVQTSRTYGAGHVAPPAIQGIAHRVDAALSARRSKTRTQRIGARISRSASLPTTTTIQRICLRIDTNVVAGRGPSRTNTLPIHTRCGASTSVVTHTAMRVARHFIDAIGATRVLRRARTCSRLAYSKPWTRRVFVEHPIAVVILAVAFLHRPRKGRAVVVVAIHSPADNRRLTIVVLVER